MAGTLQTAAAEARPDVRCGSFCLFVALQALEIGPGTFEELDQRLGPPGPRGYSMHELQTAAERYGAMAMVVDTSLSNLRHRSRPFTCIGNINNDHFALIADIDDKRVQIIDPPRIYETSLNAFVSVWDGKALIISKSPLASEEWVKRSRLATQIAPPVCLFVAIVVGTFLFLARKRFAFLSGRAASILLLGLNILGLTGCDRPTKFPSSIPRQVDDNSGRWLFVSEDRKDLGVIFKHDDQQEQSFSIRLENRGPAPLDIQQISTSCACTRTEITEHNILPGRSATLTAFVRIGDKLAANSACIALTTSDPVQSHHEITLEWQVDLPLRTVETALEMAPLSPGESVQKTLPVLLHDMTLCPSCRLLIRSSSQTMTCTVDMHSGPRSSTHESSPLGPDSRTIGQLMIRIQPQNEDNFYRGTAHVELVCQDRRRASFSLPVTWTVASVIQASLSRSFLGTTKPAERLTSRIVLHSRSGQPFRVVNIEHNDSIEVVGPFSTEQVDPVHHLELAIRAPAVEGPWREVVRVRTDQPGGNDVSASFSGIVVVAKGTP